MMEPVLAQGEHLLVWQSGLHGTGLLRLGLVVLAQ